MRSTVLSPSGYELRDKAGKVLDHGKYIVIWRREGGNWMFAICFQRTYRPRRNDDAVRHSTPIPAGVIRVPGLLYRAMAGKADIWPRME